MSHESFLTIREDLREHNLKLCPEDESWDKLQEMRRLYEPYVFTLSRHLRMDVAPWTHPAGVKDNWVTTNGEVATRTSRIEVTAMYSSLRFGDECKTIGQRRHL